MNLQQRVERLERSNRRLWAVTLIAAIGIASTFLMGQAEKIPAEIKAHKFTLVDASGRARVQIREIGGVNAAIYISDSDGTLRATLGSERGVAGLTLFGEKGRGRVALQATGAGQGLRMLDAQKRLWAGLGNSEDGPAFTLYGEQGRATVASHVAGPSVYITNAGGQPVWRRP